MSKDGSKPKRSAKWDLDLQPLKESEARASERIANRLLGRDQVSPDAQETIAKSAMVDTAMANEPVQLWQTAIVAESATVAISAIVGPVAGFTSIPNTILDSVAQAVTPTEFAVYLRLYRLSHGFKSNECNVGYERIARACHISRRTAQTAISRLEKLGLIERVTTGKSHKEASRYRVFVPGEATADLAMAKSAIAKSATNKYSLKETIKGAPVASAPAPTLSVYDVRTIAARFREVHHGQPDYTRDCLHADVRTVLIGEGREPDDRLIDEAIGG